MAGGQERILKRRIRSVQSTRKTTRAMELIAGSRIVRAQQRIVGARPYSERVTALSADIAAAPGDRGHRLLGGGGSTGAVALVVIAADRGLCGGYNSFVLRAAEARLRALAREGRAAQVTVVGRKGVSYLRYREQQVDHSITGITDSPGYEDARQVAEAVNGPFRAGEVERVEIVSTRFVSAGSQKVETATVVPLGAESGTEGVAFDYELEPERDELLEALAPLLIEASVFIALLEASASEHAARQRAMKAATDNADELITNLRRVMNRVRQDAITTEIMDIVGGAEALRQASGAEDVARAE